MVKKNIGLALVGCGQIAKAHMRAIAALENAQLVFTVDADVVRAREAADAFGALHGAASYEEVLASDVVDAVVLCLPHDLHLPFTLQAAQAGKHILVEKPMALDESEARQMAEGAASGGVELSVGHSTRCLAPYRRAKALMLEGALGRIVNVVHQRLFWVERLSTDWRRSAASCGGLYLPLFGSHDIDAML
jgi:UDP-N-acetylglucosamine 3-dehydrogenase